MKKKEIEVYEFKELNDYAKRVAIEDARKSMHPRFSWDEKMSCTIEKVEEEFESDEYIIQQIEANDWNFLEDGTFIAL